MGLYDQLTGMEEILDDFVIETNELIEKLNSDLLLLENGADRETVNGVFRVFHTIKGTAGFLYFNDCQNLAHVAENVLDQIRNEKLEPNSDIIDSLLHTVDWFKEFIEHVSNRDEFNVPIKPLILDLQKHSHSIDVPDIESTDMGESSSESNNSSDSDNFEREVITLNIPQELINEFIYEAKEQLDFLSADLLNLEIEPDNQDLVNNLFRAFHTLKGNSGLMGLEQFSIVAHKSEDILGLVREGKLTPDSKTIDALLAAVDWMKIVVDEVVNQEITTHDIRSILDALDGNETKTVEKNTPIKKEISDEKPDKDSDSVRVKKRVDQTIRVDVERLDRLMNLAGELILEKNRLLQVSKGLKGKFDGDDMVGNLDGVNNSIGYITTEIQDGVMQMRMLPISTVFQKFPRLIRDLARDKGKEIKLDIRGETTELDRSVIEAIGDPMVHLLRNAADHGIESPEVRKSAGKDEQGTIGLNAYQEGNNIVITISDDGAGIDPDKISKIAIEKKIVTEEEVGLMNANDRIKLIFKPGFSTAKKVTDVSGRGVGMDVVHTNVAKLNGTVDIESTVGMGSIFTIKLPLTLAIMNGMVVKSFDELFIIPIITISETLRFDEKNISHIRGQEMLQLRGSVIPLIRLHDVFNVPLGKEKSFYVVVVQIAERKLGLLVTGLLGKEETVVKPLGKALGKVRDMAGGTIRGDGKVSLIIDIPELMKTNLN